MLHDAHADSNMKAGRSPRLAGQGLGFAKRAGQAPFHSCAGSCPLRELSNLDPIKPRGVCQAIVADRDGRAGPGNPRQLSP
jgi:hypothetical protein